MLNELLFVAESIVVSLFALVFAYFGSAGLFVFSALSWVTGNIFMLKEVILFGLPTVTTDVFAVGCDIGITLLREYYDEKDAQRAIMLGMLTLVFFVVVSQLLLLYVPSGHDIGQAFYMGIFSKVPRIMLSSIAVAAMSKSLNLFLLHKLSHFWPHASLKIKSLIAMSLSQLFDTILFTVLALYGTVESVTNVIILGFCIKFVSIVICVPLVTSINSYIMKKYKRS